MRYSKCTMQDLQDALDKANVKYKGNLEFNRFDKQGFTLKVKDSKGPGHRLHIRPDFNKGGFDTTSQKTRRSISACWHVHGDFFDALFSVKPDAVIYSKGARITIEDGNWQDANIGSRMFPLMFSDACDCSKPQIKTVNQSQMTAECWGIQVWGPDHCRTCEFKDTSDCGGQTIIATGKNESGYTVPLS